MERAEPKGRAASIGIRPARQHAGAEREREMKAAERDKVRAMTQRVAKTNAKRHVYTGQILAMIGESKHEGAITRRECMAIIQPRAETEERRAFNNAMSRLLREGRVIEEPMIEITGRATRVNPVMVMKIVGSTQ